MKENVSRKALVVSFSAALLGIMVLPLARSQTTQLSPLHWSRRFPERVVSQGPAGPVVEAPRLMATASPDIAWVQCPPPAQALATFRRKSRLSGRVWYSREGQKCGGERLGEEGYHRARV